MGPTFDEAFFESLPFHREGFMLDRLVEVDSEARRVVCEMNTDKPFPLIDGQRVDPVVHPAHLPGGIIIHLTGMLGFTSVYHFQGLRFDEGWAGYGTRIHRADFKRLVRLGPLLRLECREMRERFRFGMYIIRYNLLFTQEGQVAYTGDQTAVFQKDGGPGLVASTDRDAPGATS